MQEFLHFSVFFSMSMFALARCYAASRCYFFPFSRIALTFNQAGIALFFWVVIVLIVLFLGRSRNMIP